MTIPDLRFTTGNSAMGHMSSLEDGRISDEKCGFFFTQNVGTSNSKVHKFPQNRHHRRASLVRILFETFLMETFHPFLKFAQLCFFLPLHLLKRPHPILWPRYTKGQPTSRTCHWVLSYGSSASGLRLSNAHAVVVHSQGRELAEYSSHESRNVLPNFWNVNTMAKKAAANCKSYIAYFLKMCTPPNKKKDSIRETLHGR